MNPEWVLLIIEAFLNILVSNIHDIHVYIYIYVIFTNSINQQRSATKFTIDPLPLQLPGTSVSVSMAQPRLPTAGAAAGTAGRSARGRCSTFLDFLGESQKKGKNMLAFFGDSLAFFGNKSAFWMILDRFFTTCQVRV